MLDALHELESLLRKVEQPYHANAVRVALGYALADDERLWASLCSSDWWGDSNSIAAVEPAVLGGFTPEARHDSRRIRELMLSVYNEMQNHCIPPPEAKLMAAQFNKWLASQM
ncbi:MAG: hypothetical protein P8Z31_07550 [Gammaproteobacteria bacterium]|jgi:hypothetical protein